MFSRTIFSKKKGFLFLTLFCALFASFTSSASAACTEHNMSYGDSVNSAIDASDCDTSPRGASYYAEKVTFNGTQDDTINAIADWASFDGYMYLTDGGNNVLEQNDDYEGTNRSLIRYTLPTTGTYTLWLTTYSANVIGNYSLSLDLYVDTEPDSFSFTDMYGESINSLVVSDTQTITGFDGVLTASVSGDGSPQIEINNSGNWVTSGDIEDGQSLRVRLTSSSSYSESFSALVSVGTAQDSWVVGTKDYHEPEVVSFSPPNASTGAFTAHDLSMTFDRNIQLGTGNIVIKKSLDDSPYLTIGIDSQHVSGWGTDTVTIDLPTPLEHETAYYANVDPTAVKDQYDGYYPGISDNNTWRFTTRALGDNFSFEDTFNDTSFIDQANTDADLSVTGQVGLNIVGWGKMSGTVGSDNVSNNSEDSTRPVMKLDPFDTPVIVWTDATPGNDEIFLSRWNGSAWAKMDGTVGNDNVSDNSGYSWNPRFILTASGFPIIVWEDTTTGQDGIYLKKWNGSAWTKMDGTAGVDVLSANSGYAFDAQVVLDSNNYPIVVWYEGTVSPLSTDIFLTRWNGTAWVRMNGTAGYDNLSSTSGRSFYPQIALDSSWRPHVVWQDYATGLGDVYFTHWNGTAWVRMNGTAGYDNLSANAQLSNEPRLVLTSSGNPIVTWYDETTGNNDIYVSHWNGSAWTKMDGTAGYDNVSANEGHSGYGVRIALGSSNNPIVAWYDGTTGNGDIYLSHWNGSAWSKMDGTAGYDNVSGNYSSSAADLDLTVDSSGNPMVVSVEAGVGGSYDISFARWNASAWTKMNGNVGSDNVSNTLGYPLYPQIALSSTGDPVIAWEEDDSGNKDIYVARWSDDYVITGVVQSPKINGLIGEITRATLTATDDTPGASSITYYLTNDGGVAWHGVSKGSEFTFPSVGNDLRWRAVLTKGSSPILYDVQVGFTSSETDSDGGPIPDGSSSTNETPHLNLDINSTISIGCDTSVSMNAIVGTGKSTIDDNNLADCTVTTNNSSGYKMEWQASADDMLSGTGDHFASYSPAASTTPEIWSIPNTTSAWGAKLAATSEGYNGGSGGSGYTYPGTGWGSDDSYANGKFLNVAASSPFQIMQKAIETDVNGETQSIMFAAEIGADKLQPTGTYAQEVTVTAMTL